MAAHLNAATIARLAKEEAMRTAAQRAEEERIALAREATDRLDQAKKWAVTEEGQIYMMAYFPHYRRQTEEMVIELYEQAMDGLQIKQQKIASLTENTGITPQEAEAILAHLSRSRLPTRCSVQPTGGPHIERLYTVFGYTKNTLLALQVVNRFAAANGIRPEDAITVFREYC